MSPIPCPECGRNPCPSCHMPEDECEHCRCSDCRHEGMCCWCGEEVEREGMQEPPHWMEGD